MSMARSEARLTPAELARLAAARALLAQLLAVPTTQQEAGE